MNAASWLESLPAPDRWRELLLAYGPKLAAWVLALALGIQAALIVTDLAGGKPASSSAISAPRGAGAFGGQRVDVLAIANGHLFGDAHAGNATQDAAHAPETHVPLVLTGIIAADDPSMGLAIVGESAAVTKVYAVGQMLPGSVKLHAVYNDRILLDRNGTLESLALPHQSVATAPAPSAAGLTMSESPVVERMRRLIADEPGVISDIMRPQPVFVQGKQTGYRVYPGRNRQAFFRLGLRPGDLVTAINGTPLDDPARGQEIFQTLGSSSEARVTVTRGGRQQDLSLNMAQVAQEAEQLLGADAAGAAQAPGAAPAPGTAPAFGVPAGPGAAPAPGAAVAQPPTPELPAERDN